ncbi:MAG TPA: hypothetical protein VG056_08915 [Pirellulales bacterium]|jgi:hypothetical protein|nr:hypothetical protein [Pirellulales bacterium]
MPAVFDRLGVHFQYPENWTLEAANEADVEEVTVYGPGGTFWSLTIHERGDPEELMDVVVDAMRAEYDELDAEAINDSIAAQALAGYDLNFYCLDLTNTAQIRAFSRGAKTYLLIWQAEDRDFDLVLPVFRAITTSLIHGK